MAGRTKSKVVGYKPGIPMQKVFDESPGAVMVLAQPVLLADGTRQEGQCILFCEDEDTALLVGEGMGVEFERRPFFAYFKAVTAEAMSFTAACKKVRAIVDPPTENGRAKKEVAACTTT